MRETGSRGQARSGAPAGVGVVDETVVDNRLAVKTTTISAEDPSLCRPRLCAVFQPGVHRRWTVALPFTAGGGLRAYRPTAASNANLGPRRPAIKSGVNETLSDGAGLAPISGIGSLNPVFRRGRLRLNGRGGGGRERVVVPIRSCALAVSTRGQPAEHQGAGPLGVSPTPMAGARAPDCRGVDAG